MKIGTEYQEQHLLSFNVKMHYNQKIFTCMFDFYIENTYLHFFIYTQRYFGHSAGQSFLRGTTVRNLSKCAVSLLMGCSSGKMESNGEYDPHGYILNYLVAGSPAVVGNLWDVTDRSIDELTKHMLEKWGVLDKSKGKSLVQAVMESRDKSNLKYLIGAAPVVYGVPVYL